MSFTRFLFALHLGPTGFLRLELPFKITFFPPYFSLFIMARFYLLC